MMKLRGAAVALSGACLVVAVGTPASATDKNVGAKACNAGWDFALRYNSNQTGAYRYFGYSEGNFDRGADYLGPWRYCDDTRAPYKSGSGKPVKNNAASAQNKSGTYKATVYFNSWWKGASDTLRPNTKKNLKNTYNQNASFKWHS
ncbi:hypothetical protein AB0B50_32345 [Streptomyces sp. NPDC041068]|uniref:hypothetical protein n=1 Tax=Streptomyces sp. NPDC041068 TaxID=3155130 RepID=UPI0033F8FFBE